jgi:hypothetical protein
VFFFFFFPKIIVEYKFVIIEERIMLPRQRAYTVCGRSACAVKHPNA